jgi:two-component system LytT family response regulator
MALSRRQIQVLVVDDEPIARRNLIVLLRRDPDIGAVAECGSGPEAIQAMRGSRYDLVFLDVQMPECDGFDVLEMLGADLPPAIVFVTAYEDYALRAFEAGALDYLLKPFDDSRFSRALDRAKDKIAYHLSAPSQRTQRLAIKGRGELVFLDVAEIDWIEAASYYACVHAGAETHILRRSLADLEHDLGEENFVRIHRSIIVNLDRVRGLELQASGEYEVVLKSQVRLRLSRRFRKGLQDRLRTLTPAAFSASGLLP